MTRKRWNAGVFVVLTVLLSMAPTLRFGTAVAEGNTEPIAAGLSSTDTERCATLHRIDAPTAGENQIDLHIEALRGILVAEKSEASTCRLLLINSRIPADLAGVITINHALLNSITFMESNWGHESEARIELDLVAGVSVDTVENEGGTSVVLQKDGLRFDINLIATPYPVVPTKNAADTQALKSQLLALSAADNEKDKDAWWGDSAKGEMKEMLRSVRNADTHARVYDAAMLAAQEEQAPAEEPAQEAPAVEEAAPATEVAEPVTPPAPRELKAPLIGTEANKALAKEMIAAAAPPLSEVSEEVIVRKEWKGDPLKQPVTLDLRKADPRFVVALLATKAGINIVANKDLGDEVEIYLKDVPLLKAMETVLSLNGLGLIEKEGIYHIVPYLDAIAADRVTDVVEIENADAEEIASTLKDVVAGSEFESLISISANKTANTVIVSGPTDHIGSLLQMAKRLDVEQMVLPTVTMPIKLNYADPKDIVLVVESILTKDVGTVTVDERARILVVTDIPIIIEQITALVEQLDIPVKQVAIDAMIVDVTLTDAADTGVDWLISAVQSQSRRDAAGNTGIFTGNLQELSLNSNLSIGDAAGLLNFGILSGDVDWRGVIQAEVRNNNSTLLSNPKLITVENQPATITIASEIPYVELTQTDRGGQQTSTKFKPIGTELTVTPTVTHDNHIIAKILAKESTSSQAVNGVPVEDKREINTTPHIASGQTIYVGGLRKNNDTVSVRKVPLLGDVPVVNFLFRSNQRSETVNELLIFLTCTVLEENPSLTEYQEERANQVREARIEVNAETALINDTVYPGEMRDPAWKWRKSKKAE